LVIKEHGRTAKVAPWFKLLAAILYQFDFMKAIAKCDGIARVVAPVSSNRVFSIRESHLLS
jgi:hypothetical protein